MVDTKIFSVNTRICNNISERPNTVVCLNCIVCKVKEGFGPKLATKHSIGLILQIVLLIILFIRVDLSVSKVKGKVEEITVRGEVVLDLLWRCTRT